MFEVIEWVWTAARICHVMNDREKNIDNWILNLFLEIVKLAGIDPWKSSRDCQYESVRK